MTFWDEAENHNNCYQRKIGKTQTLFLAFYTSGHLINAAVMDSVHWLFHQFRIWWEHSKILEFQRYLPNLQQKANFSVFYFVITNSLAG